jgi:methionyl-tRNA formyltransferase
MRLIFMGTPHFAVPALQALLNGGHEVVAVYSQPPRPAGIPVHTPVSLKGADEQAIFAAYTADAAIVAAYGLLLPQPILDAPKLGCINIHPSDLPRWRGAAPLQRTIMAGDTHTAMCIMQMEAGLDTGPVLLRHPVGLKPETTTAQLHDAMSKLGAECLLKVLADLPGHPPVVQSTDGVTYATKISKAEARLDWRRTAQELQQHVLGLNPAPGANFMHDGEQVKVLQAKAVITPFIQADPGTVISGDGFAPVGSLIACGKDALQLIEIQRPGKKALPFEAATLGWPVLTVGTQLALPEGE